MDTIDTTKLLSTAQQRRFSVIAKRHGITDAQLAELAIKQALYATLNLAGTPLRKGNI